MCLAESAQPGGHWSSVPETLRPSLELLSNELAERPTLCWSELALLVLGVRVEHVERFLFGRPVVDHAEAAALSSAWSRPAQLPNAAVAANDWSLFWPEHERDLQAAIALGVEQSIAFVKIGVSTKRMIDYTPMTDICQLPANSLVSPTLIIAGTIPRQRFWTRRFQAPVCSSRSATIGSTPDAKYPFCLPTGILTYLMLENNRTTVASMIDFDSKTGS